MRIASLAEVKAKLSAFLDEAGSTGPVVITRNGKAVAVLLAPADDDDLERLLLSRSPRFRSLLSKARKSIRSGKGVPHDEFWKATPVADAPRPPARGGERVKRTAKRKSAPAPRRTDG